VKTLIVLSLALIVFASGCTQVTCNKPYINVGDECCLDMNDNAICDKDESQKVNTDEFFLTEANFDFVGITPYNDFDQRCEIYKMFLNQTLPNGGSDENTRMGFYVTYNIKDVPEEFQEFPGKPQFPILKDYVSCSLEVEGKAFQKLDVSRYGVNNIDRSEFCDNAIMSTTSQYCVPPVKNPSLDITKDTSMTLCCQGVCKTKTVSGCN
jgi:hypothetical protein